MNNKRKGDGFGSFLMEFKYLIFILFIDYFTFES